MIKKIDMIKNIQTFSNFSWLNLEEFKKYNLIFGENGTGKTAISRIFRSIEESSNLDEWATYGSNAKDISIKLTFDDGISEYNYNKWENSVNKKIHVFNRDFINENFQENLKKFDCNDVDVDDSIKGLLGKEKILLEKKTKETDKLKDEILLLTNEVEEIINNSIKENDSFKTKGKNVATDNINLDSIKKEKVEDMKSLEAKIKANKDAYSLLKDIESDDSFPININFNLLLKEKRSNIDQISSKENIYLYKSFSEDSLMNEFLVKKEFILEGMNLFDPKNNTCPFCRQKLNESAKKLLKGYKKFVESKNVLAIESLEKIVENIGKSKIIEFSELLGVVDKYESIIYDTSPKKSKKINLVTKVNDVITLIVEKINLKKSDLSLDIEAEMMKLTSQLIKCYDELELACSEYVKIEKKKEQATKECKNCRTKANEYLRRKIMVLNKNKIQKLDKLLSKKENFESELITITSEYKKLLNNVNAQSATMNKILRDIGLGEFEINQNLELAHKNSLTKTNKLSEGEKGIIAFTFFVGKLRGLYSKSNNLDDLIIVVDDPVDSTSNIFFERIFTMLKRLNWIISSEKKNIGQLFVLTHNYKLSSKIKRFFDEKEQNEKKKCLKNETNYNNISTNFEIVKNQNLSTFEVFSPSKSMYYSKIKKIKEICDSNVDIEDEERLYVGNYIRYVLETFNLFKRQNNGAFSDLECLLPDDIENLNQPYKDVEITNQNKDSILINLIKTVSDEESHSNTEDFYFFENYCSKKELKDTAKVLLNYIFLVDDIHYKNLGL